MMIIQRGGQKSNGVHFRALCRHNIISRRKIEPEVARLGRGELSNKK